MNENILALIKKVMESEDLQAKFAAQDSPDAAYELARGIQEGFTKEEFVEAMTALSAAEDGSITDEDLAETAGGDYVDYDDLPVSVKQSVDVMYSVGTGAIEASKSIAKSATVVSDSIADSATVVSNSIADSATAVSKSIAKSASEVYSALSAVSDYSVNVSKSVSKSVSKITKALAV